MLVFQKICFVLLAVLLLLNQSTMAQEVRFSQYQSTPMLTNPAFAGTEGDYSLDLNYRVQNIGLLAYRTGYSSFTVPIYDKSQEPRLVGGVSLGAINDMAGEAGEIITNGINLSAAYRVLFDQYGVQSLTFGLQGEYMQTRVDFGDLLWPSQVSYNGFDLGRPATELIEGRDNFLRFNAGLLWNYNPANHLLKSDKGPQAFMGFAVSNLNSPEQTFLRNGSYEIPVLFKLHGGAKIPLRGRFSLAPDFLVMSQRQTYQFMLGTLLNMQKDFRSPSNPLVSQINLFAGAWYRSSDALVLLVGASNRRFSAAFSYDLNTVPAKAGISGQGGVELSLSFRFLRDNKPRKISSPLF